MKAKLKMLGVMVACLIALAYYTALVVYVSRGEAYRDGYGQGARETWATCRNLTTLKELKLETEGLGHQLDALQRHIE